jgi:hypothetical protein
MTGLRRRRSAEGERPSIMIWHAGDSAPDRITLSKSALEHKPSLEWSLNFLWSCASSSTVNSTTPPSCPKT